MLNWLHQTWFAHNSLLAWAYATGSALPGFLLVAGTLYRDIQQRVNFEIMAQLEALRVSFAAPVREIRPHDASVSPLRRAASH